MKNSLFVGLLILGLSGCNAATTSNNSSQPIQQASVQPEAKVEEVAIVDNSIELTFIDISGFDEDLSLGMDTRNREIVVDMPGKVSLNDVPVRLDQWFAEIKEAGGKVQAKPVQTQSAVKTRGIVGMLIDVGVKAREAYAKKQMLAPAQNYNVLLEYNKDNGIIERAVFYHK